MKIIAKILMGLFMLIGMAVVMGIVFVFAQVAGAMGLYVLVRVMFIPLVILGCMCMGALFEKIFG